MNRTKPKRRIFIVPHAGYPFDVLVAIGLSDRELLAVLNKKGVELDSGDDALLHMEGRGRTVMLGGGQTVLCLRSFRGTPDEWGNLAHEIFHAVEFLMTRIGIRLSRESDEAFAYAIGNLTQRIAAELRKR